MACRCSEILVGSRPTGSYNWHPDCPEHGARTEWYSSPAQVRRREDESARLRTVQLLARQRRSEAVNIPAGVLRGLIDANAETEGFAIWWYLSAGGSTYLLGDVY